MFLILCIAGLVGAIIATALIFLFHLKQKSIVLPFILFFVFIVIFGIGTFLYLADGVLFGIPAPKITSLVGNWLPVDTASEDTYQIATIGEETIDIYWCTPTGETTSLYWSGTFEAPETLEDTYTWTSVNDIEKTGTGLFASTDEEKVFTYEKGQLSYEVSVLGVTKTIYLAKDEPEPEVILPLGIDETLETEHFQFRIESVSAVDSITNSAGVTYTPKKKNVFLLAVITTINTSDETKNILNTSFNAFVDEKQINAYSVIGEVYDKMPLSCVLSPGMEFTAYTVWEVPQDWVTLQFSYVDALTGQESTAYAIHPEDLKTIEELLEEAGNAEDTEEAKEPGDTEGSGEAEEPENAEVSGDAEATDQEEV